MRWRNWSSLCNAIVFQTSTFCLCSSKLLPIIETFFHKLELRLEGSDNITNLYQNLLSGKAKEFLARRGLFATSNGEPQTTVWIPELLLVQDEVHAFVLNADK